MTDEPSVYVLRMQYEEELSYLLGVFTYLDSAQQAGLEMAARQGDAGKPTWSCECDGYWRLPLARVVYYINRFTLDTQNVP